MVKANVTIAKIEISNSGLERAKNITLEIKCRNCSHINANAPGGVLNITLGEKNNTSLVKQIPSLFPEQKTNFWITLFKIEEPDIFPPFLIVEAIEEKDEARLYGFPTTPKEGVVLTTKLDFLTYPAQTFFNLLDILKRPSIYLLALIPLAILVGYILIKKIRTKIQRRLILSKIKKEINDIKETLENDKLSKSIFHFTAWDSDYNNWKHHIINNYDDYNLIKKFYEELKERDITFSQEGIKNEIIKDYNESILSLSQIILTNIKWKK